MNDTTQAPHTPGRLKAGIYQINHLSRRSLFHAVADELDVPIAVTGPTEAQDAAHAESDARRLAACWNACENAATEVIERLNEEPRLLLREMARVKQLTDDLAAAKQREAQLVAALQAAEDLYRVGLLNAAEGQVERVTTLRRAALAAAGAA